MLHNIEAELQLVPGQTVWVSERMNTLKDGSVIQTTWRKMRGRGGRVTWSGQIPEASNQLLVTLNL